MDHNNNGSESFDDDEEVSVLLEMASYEDVIVNNDVFFGENHWVTIFRIPHKCPDNSEDDPLHGIFKEIDKCCAMKQYLDSQSDLTMQQARSTMTPFGVRLHAINVMFETQVDNLAADIWMSTEQPVDSAILKRILKATSRHMDNDKVLWSFGPCSVCCADFRFVRTPPCCSSSICSTCWQNYIDIHCREKGWTVNVTGNYNLNCYSCRKLVPFSECLSCTDAEQVSKLRPKIKPNSSVTKCPRCLKQGSPIIAKNLAPKRGESILKKFRMKKGGRPYQCEQCGHIYCLICGIDNHAPYSCDEMTSAKVGLRYWSKQTGNSYNPNFQNGRSCPICHIMVSHSGGCPHMKCPCGAEFCYLCGQRYFNFPFLRSHSSPKILPLISCSKKWKNKRTRIAVHSAVSLGLVTVGLPLMLALSPIAVPTALTWYLVDKHKRSKASIVL